MDVFSEDSLTGEDLKVARVLTLQVEGVEIGNETQASKAIERFGNAALFEIDYALGVGLRLRRLVGRAHKAVEHEANIPKYLALEYDMEPMSLYWYARSATDLPLLAFLAYYQVIEFYFPIHSRRKALEALRTTLAGLTFETMREADLVKVLETIKANRKGSFGPEREQLKATLEQCVSQESLREFFLEDRGRRYFFSSEACTVISPTTVPASDAPRDWRSEVARRVYEIRNRIVHAKGGYDDLGPLLPNDLETKQLSHDIALVRFLARQVLHTNARPLGG